MIFGNIVTTTFKLHDEEVRSAVDTKIVCDLIYDNLAQKVVELCGEGLRTAGIIYC